MGQAKPCVQQSGAGGAAPFAKRLASPCTMWRPDPGLPQGAPMALKRLWGYRRAVIERIWRSNPWRPD